MIDESPLTVRFPLLGRETTNVKDWSIDSDYMTPADAFEFTLFDRDVSLLRRLELQPVELVVGGASQLIGRIDKTRRGDDGTAVHCAGRDYLADIVEGNIDPTYRVSESDAIRDVLLDVCGPYGISAVLDDSDVTLRNIRTGVNILTKKPAPGFVQQALKDLKPQPGQGIFDFINQICARNGCTVQPGENRSQLVVAAPHYDTEPPYSIVRTSDEVNDRFNNVVSAVAERDFSRIPTHAIVQGFAARAGESGRNATQSVDLWAMSAEFRSELGEILSATTISDRWKPGSVADQVKSGALYRLFVHRDERCRTAEQIDFAARRAIAERLKDTLYYRATLRGHRCPKSGAIWSVNTMVDVDDEIADVHEPLWIASRRLAYSPSGAASTNLVCWRPESFTLGTGSPWGGAPKSKPKTQPKAGQPIGSAVGETEDAEAGV